MRRLISVLRGERKHDSGVERNDELEHAADAALSFPYLRRSINGVVR
jgi:hypothetical protein